MRRSSTARISNASMRQNTVASRGPDFGRHLSPWDDFTLKSRTKSKKRPVTRSINLRCAAKPTLRSCDARCVRRAATSCCGSLARSASQPSRSRAAEATRSRSPPLLPARATLPQCIRSRRRSMGRPSSSTPKPRTSCSGCPSSATDDHAQKLAWFYFGG